MPAQAGHNADLSFDIETAFNDGGGGSPQPFGLDATLSTAEGSNNATRMYEPDSREASTVEPQEFAGSFSVEFTLTNPYWIDAAISTGTDDGTGTLVYEGETPETFTVHSGTGSYQRALTGCVVNSISISVSTGEAATVTLDGDYADESDASVTQPTVANDPMQFFDASLSVGGTTRQLTQEVELSIENNSDLVYELGSRFAADFSPKQREVSVDYTEIVNSSDNITDFYGGTTPSTDPNSSDMTLSFDDGGTNTITFDVTAALHDSFSNSGIGDPEADLEESLTSLPATITASASGY